MNNKYIEKCFSCSLSIPINEREFVEQHGKYKIFHKTCIQITKAVPRSTDIHQLREEIINRLSDNRLIFYKLLSKKLSHRVHRKPNVVYTWIPEIFLNSFDIFWDKYRTRDLDYESAKKILFRICDIQSLIYIEKKIDEAWWGSLPKEARKTGLKPPSFFYHKNYLELNRERINQRRRENYQTNPKLKMQRKIKYYKVEKPRIEQLRNIWQKSSYVRALKDIHSQELQNNP